MPHPHLPSPPPAGAAPDATLLVDLYEATMAQAYVELGMADEAVFSLFVRRLPPGRNYLLACGLDTALDHLAALRFDAGAVDYLRGLGLFGAPFLDWLARFRFSGSVFALPEGTPVFANEPLLEVVAPIAEAQLLETYLLNQIGVQTLIASKAARVVAAAGGRPVVDFGCRRAQGIDAAVQGARAMAIAGVAATSNLAAGRRHGLPVAGTMAHSFVQAFVHEADAFRAFAALYPETILLADTYDTPRGIARVIELARALGPEFRVRGVRLDSGDLGALAVEARRMLDGAGLDRVQIFASGGLDEHEIARLLAAGAPIDAFGVGTEMSVSGDAPAFDIAYKLTAYAGEGRMKLSTGKLTLPGRKQVFRSRRDGIAAGDVIARADEALAGAPLLGCVMRAGERLARPTLAAIRAHARAEADALPPALRALAPADPPYPVAVSPALAADRDALRARLLAEV